MGFELLLREGHIYHRFSILHTGNRLIDEIDRAQCVTWPIEPHTLAKHAILRHYLGAWLAIFSNIGARRIVYIDGFAGPGIYDEGEPGSPIIALKTAINHKRKLTSKIVFFFIEIDPKKSQSLKAEITKLGKLPANFQIGNTCGKFDQTMNQVLDEIGEEGASLAPSFVFIDPFGFSGIPMSVISRIMKNKKCEVLITFMHSRIYRFKSRKELWQMFDDEIFGSDGWKKAFQIQDDEKCLDFLRDFYMKQLENVAEAKFVRSFEMLDPNDKPIYCLIHATNSEKGLLEMKRAFWNIDKTGQYRFSDKTIPGQTILMGADLTPLKTFLQTKLKGVRIHWKLLWREVNKNTLYLEKHLRQVLSAMEDESPPSIIVEIPNRRKKGEFPEDRTIITIL